MHDTSSGLKERVRVTYQILPLFFRPLLNKSQIASGKKPIPLLYGIIYRQLPIIEKATSAKLKRSYIIRRVTSDISGRFHD